MALAGGVAVGATPEADAENVPPTPWRGEGEVESEAVGDVGADGVWGGVPVPPPLREGAPGVALAAAEGDSGALPEPDAEPVAEAIPVAEAPLAGEPVPLAQPVGDAEGEGSCVCVPDAVAHALGAPPVGVAPPLPLPSAREGEPGINEGEGEGEAEPLPGVAVPPPLPLGAA